MNPQLSRGIAGHDDESTVVDVQGIVDELAQSIRRPITLEDAGGRLLAYSVHEQPVDSVRVETLLRRGASSLTLDALRSRGVYKSIESAEDLARVPSIPELGFSSRVCLAIRSSSRLLGYLWVVDPDSALPKSAEESILKARHKLATLLSRKESVSEAKDAQRSQFIAELLGRDHGSDDVLTRRGKTMGWYPSGSLIAVIVRDPSIANRSPVIPPKIEEVFLQYCPNCLRGVYADEVAAVLAGSEAKAVEELAEALSHAIDRQDRSAAVGVGGACDTLSSVRRSYLEAQSAIALGAKLMGNTRRFDYTMLAPYELLSCLATCKKVSSYGRESIEKVLTYDALHAGSLFSTLEVFLDYCGQRKKAASRLCIHPNTLDYRIQKVRELTGIDLEDPSARLIAHIWVKALSAQAGTGVQREQRQS